MSLTYDQRAAIVGGLTASANASPRRYRFRVVAWIVLGYAIVALMLAIALALSAGTIFFMSTTHTWYFLKFGWLPIAYAWVLGRALFVRVPPPDGRTLQRHEAPKLFAAIDEIRERLRVPRLDGVMVTAGMNAMVIETPRFGGLFGWRRHLIIGTPLLIALGAEEMRAVLAHELGHLSGRHGRIAAWSWRVRLTWGTVVASIDGRRGVRFLQKLMHWYVERLMLVTLVLARKQEHAADEAAAELTSRETAARALAWVVVATQLIDARHWNPLWESVTTNPHAPPHPLDDLLRRRVEVLAPPFDEILAAELERKTALDDTHPSLRERLAHLGVPQPELGVASSCAADELLGRMAANIIAERDREWRAAVAPRWEQQHRVVAAAVQEFEQQVVVPEDAPVAALHARAEKLVSLGRDADAQPLYEALLTRNPDDATAAFHLGRMRLKRGDLSGLEHIEIAMRDWRWIGASCDVAYNALREQGREEAAHVWVQRYEQHQELIQRANAEAATLSVRNSFSPTELPRETQEKIIEHCRKARWVSKVWMARKNLTAVPTSVEFIAVRSRMFRFASAARLKALAAAIQADVSISVFRIDNGSLMRRLDKVAGKTRL